MIYDNILIFYTILRQISYYINSFKKKLGMKRMNQCLDQSLTLKTDQMLCNGRFIGHKGMCTL